MSQYFRNSEENDIQLFVLVLAQSASWLPTAPFQSSLPHQKPSGHLLTRSTSLPTFKDEPGVQLHLCWGLLLCVWHTMNVRLSKCQSMPADAHWDLEHHRFHCTNKCSRTWQGSYRLCERRKTCQGWFSYRLGERWGEELGGRLTRRPVCRGNRDKQAACNQVELRSPPPEALAFWHALSQRKKCPSPAFSCQNVLLPMWLHPANEALCLANTDISSAPKCDGKILSKNLPWKLFPLPGKRLAQPK